MVLKRFFNKISENKTALKMGTIRYIAKNITETAESSKWIASNGDITFNATNEIIQQSKNKTRYDKYEPIATNEAEDFNITFSLNKNETTVVPLGILDFNNGYENPYFAFDYALTAQDIDALEFQIKDADGKVIYQLTNLAPVVVTASKAPQIKNEIKGLLPAYPTKTPDFRTVLEQFSLPTADYTKVGSYVLYWDGFDNDEVYDSTRFNNKKLTAKITAIKDGKRKSLKVNFSTHYEQVDWVDVKINRKNNRIDTTLRVNLQDGGAEGLDCWKNTRNFNSLHNKSEICDWDKIPAEAIQASGGKEPLKARTKSFEELKQLALLGLRKHWGRNESNKKHIIIGKEEYNVIIAPHNAEESAMDDIELVYNTNSAWGRSNNPGSVDGITSLAANALEYIPYVPLNEKLYYNIGYMKGKNNWYWMGDSSDIDDDFSYTAAHEIGHEILKAYNKHPIYSYKHKNSSDFSDPLEISNGGSIYPKTGEIDVMKYYNEEPYWKDFSRVVVAENDLLGLIWLTKIKIQ